MSHTSRDATVRDRSGESGRVIAHHLADDGLEYVVVERPNGSSRLIPLAALHGSSEDGALFLDDAFDAYRTIEQQNQHVFTTSIPIIEEELVVETREVETGHVRIRTSVDERIEVVDVPVEGQRLEIERVPVNRPADGPLEPRYENDTLIIPLVEERVVVRKELVVTEEVRIRRITETKHHHEEVTLRTERAEIDRSEPD